MKHHIGFTTMTFKPSLLAGEISIPQLFEWGAGKGFDWVEVRDFELTFSEPELLAIRADAKRQGLRVHYAWDATSVYEVKDRERFFKGIRNAALFGEGTCSRVMIAPELIHAEQGKIGYSAEEIPVLTARIREYGQYAVKYGVILAFENSKEPIAGFEDLLEAVPAMRMTFDTANTFNQETIGVPLSWAQLKNFVLRRAGQIPYVHLKSFKNGQTQSGLIADGEVPFAELLPLLSEDAWLCVELPADDSFSSGMERVGSGLKLVSRLVDRCG
ncbi:MAG: sugar phosphate isomerase/epimerase [Kiritimatiellales bacterium]